MTISVRTADKVTVLDISGEVDLYHSPELLAKLTELIKQNHMSILLNFQAVTYIDSSGLASLIGAFQANTWVALFATSGVILSAAYALYLYRRVIFGVLDKASLANAVAAAEAITSPAADGRGCR